MHFEVLGMCGRQRTLAGGQLRLPGRFQDEGRAGRRAGTLRPGPALRALGAAPQEAFPLKLLPGPWPWHLGTGSLKDPSNLTADASTPALGSPNPLLQPWPRVPAASLLGLPRAPLGHGQRLHRALFSSPRGHRLWKQAEVTLLQDSPGSLNSDGLLSAAAF